MIHCFLTAFSDNRTMRIFILAISFLVGMTNLSMAVFADSGVVQNFAVREARMTQEEQLVLNLVDDADVTHETRSSGRWGDAATWKDGRIPGDGARALIHAGHQVTLDQELDASLMSLRVDGQLIFQSDRNTRLIVDTLVSTDGSSIRMGSVANPVRGNRHAEIMVRDYQDQGMITGNPASPDYDPLRIGQGVLVYGHFEAHGAVKTPYAAIAGDGVAANAGSISLRTAPQGWKAGDEIVVLGTSPEGTQAEHRTIAAVSSDGLTLTLDTPLTHDHLVPDHTINVDLKIHVANLTRNVLIRTDPAVRGNWPGEADRETRIEHSGHVLFMHNNDVDIRYVQFVDLGRTDKSQPLNETRFNTDGSVKSVGDNQAARYPVHFHRAGWNNVGVVTKEARVEGCVVQRSPGWGYVNHSSYVNMSRNIAYQVYGSSFVTEAGDEHGEFTGNMSIESRGVGRSDVRSWKARQGFSDWGWGGHGFWLAGVYVELRDNIVNGASNFAYAIAKNPIDDVTGVVISGDGTEKNHVNVVLKRFDGNQAYGNSGGVLGILGGQDSGATQVMSNTLAFANDAGLPKGGSYFPGSREEWLSWWYPDRVKLDGITLICDINNPRNIGIGSQTKLRKTEIIEPRIEGFKIGLMLPWYLGPNHIRGGYFNNLVDMHYTHGMVNHGVKTCIEGDMQFGSLPGGQTQYRIRMDLRNPTRNNATPRQVNLHEIYFDVLSDSNGPWRLYDNVHQAADFVVDIPGYPEWSGKTNQELVDEGKAPLGGKIMPATSVVFSDSQYVSGEAVDSTPDWCDGQAPAVGLDVVTDGDLLTREGGGSDSFQVALKSAPVMDVVVSLSSSDTGEGEVTPATLTFTPADWNSAQTVTVTGVEDSLDDGSQSFHIDFSLSSGDSQYDGLSVPSVSVINLDNDPFFLDVPVGYWAYDYIQSLVGSGITSGCGAGSYCPGAEVTRAQMAVFLERGMHGSNYAPPSGTGLRFDDVPASHWAVSWIEALADDGITGGCDASNFCPGAAVSRAQMAVFLLRAKHGASWTPPAAAGSMFDDVPGDHWAADWIEQMAKEGLTSGCGGNDFCPDASVTRDAMAVFLTRVFGL